MILEILKVICNAQEYEPSCCKKEDFIKVYNAYNLELKKDGKMDFDDILRECYLLLCENHTILEQWRELYKYILIDEFQDINRIQMNIIELLASPLNNIFVVGMMTSPFMVFVEQDRRL